MKSSLFFFIISVLFFSLGCQTNEIKAFQKIHIGMDKDDVIDIMGTPKKSERWMGLDRWTYIFYQDEQRYQKEVHFDHEKAIYVGDIFQPKVSAEAQDLINESSNKEINENLKLKRQKLEENYTNYFETQKDNKSIRYAPDFQPIK